VNPAPLLAATLAVGFLAPPALARVRWLRRCPVVALALWQALAAAFVVGAGAAAHDVLSRGGATRGDLLGLLHACASATGATTAVPGGGRLELLVPLAVAAWPAVWIAAVMLRAARARRRHAATLAMVARRLPALDALVLEHATPAAYCLPGLRPRVVVTRGAVQTLSAAELGAVLAHEHAHIRGRHHLAVCFAQGFARAFPGLPLARHLRAQSGLLLEMAADDRALRKHTPADLATALYQVAAGQTPHAALGAGGRTFLLRVQRLADPTPRPRAATRAALATLAALAPLLPLLLACVPRLP
jgi:Zn-dependent protease with chaperone function